MAPVPAPLMFVTGSKTFDIKDFSTTKQIGKFNCIQSERFTVGGYDWVIEFYPQGINESVLRDVSSVSVRVLNTTEEFKATCCFWLLDWTDSKWQNYVESKVVTFSSSGAKARCRWSNNYLVVPKESPISVYVKDDKLRIKCVLCVTPRLPSPASAVKPDFDKPAGKGNQGNPSGADISFGNGFHTASYAPPNAPSKAYTKLPRQPTVRIYCEANKDLSVTIRNGTVVLAPADSNDYYQHWIKDMSYGDKVDPGGYFPAFALVNRVTGEALRNPAGEYQPVSLVPYNTNCLEDSVKWTEVWSTGFRAIRPADKQALNLTAVGYDNDTNFPDGTKIVVKYWEGKAVQNWKIVPYNSNVPY